MSADRRRRYVWKAGDHLEIVQAIGYTQLLGRATLSERFFSLCGGSMLADLSDKIAELRSEIFDIWRGL